MAQAPMQAKLVRLDATHAPSSFVLPPDWPRGPARARAAPLDLRRTASSTRSERVSNARGLSARRGARRAEHRFFVTNAESALRRAGARLGARLFFGTRLGATSTPGRFAARVATRADTD